MFDATSPSEACATPSQPSSSQAGGGPGWGTAELAVVYEGGRTRLTHLFHRAPLRVLFPKQPQGEIPVAALVNVGGGLVAGDRMSVEVAVGEGARALVTTQAAEKVYRSPGPDTRIESRLRVAAGGWLEWCPQETILFDRSRLRRSLQLDLAADARALLGEILVLGRLASGERMRQGLLFDRFEVRRDGRLVWQDRLRLAGDVAAVQESPAGLDGATALATLIDASPDAADRLDLARELADQPGVRAGATVVNGLLLIRCLAADPLALRRAFALFWTRLRQAAAGLPPVMPRLWHV